MLERNKKDKQKVQHNKKLNMKVKRFFYMMHSFNFFFCLLFDGKMSTNFIKCYKVLREQKRNSKATDRDCKNFSCMLVFRMGISRKKTL